MLEVRRVERGRRERGEKTQGDGLRNLSWLGSAGEDVVLAAL